MPTMPLTLDEANLVVIGALEKAAELGIRVSVAVCDNGGRLIAFSRMDGSSWAGIRGSMGKASASSGFRRPSGDLAQMADSSIFRSVFEEENGRVIATKGAVPAFRDGFIVGACGVGGGTGDQDEECARAGVLKLGLTVTA